MNNDETHKIECNIVRETDAAILVTAIETGEQIWIPLSQVEEIHRTRPATIVITRWIAEQKGLI